MYSQYGEDEVILEIFNGRADGRLLDVGAWHPITFSNSRALLERGWTGVLIEPSPGPVKSLVAEYRFDTKVTIIAAAVGIEPGFVVMNVTDDAVSTSSAETFATWRDQGGYLGRLTVPVLPIGEVSNRLGGFDFVNIDAEGLSVDLATAYLRGGARPTCLCVEHDNRLVELLNVAGELGYDCARANSTNAILRRVR